MKEISVFGFYGDLIFTVVSITLLVLYWYLTRTFKHWQDQGVYFIEPSIIFGNLKNRIFFRLSFHEFQLDLYTRFKGHKYGGFFEGRRPVLMICDPELIKNVMVRDFEHFVDRPTLDIRQSPHENNMLINLKSTHWKAVRALLTPTFSSGKMKAMFELVENCGTQMGQYLRDIPSSESSELEIKEFYGRFTLEVIASCAFGIQSNSFKDTEAKFVKLAARFNDISMLQRCMIFFVLLFMPKLSRFFPIRLFNPEVLSFLVEVVDNAIKHRKANESSKRNDFVQLMLDASQKEQGNESVLDEDTIIAQAILFLLAGFETSSTLLTFASYELALNPDVQENLRKEIRTVLARHNNVCNYESIQEMEYLEMVLLESLRKHPPVSRVDRTCTASYIFSDSDVHLEKGDIAAIPVIGLHYDPQFYPEPQRFLPDRFSQEQKSTRSPYVFLPFGSGPRNCIGKRFALMTTKIAMVHIVKDFLLEPSVKTEIPYKYDKFSMLLKAENGIWLSLKHIDETQSSL